jgi:hypothetical protein
MPDAEISAMQTMADALSDLEYDARERVLRWAAEKFGVELAIRRSHVRPGVAPSLDAEDILLDPTFADFVDLLDAVAPRTDVERALTGAYWLQIVQGVQSWASQAVNDLLKDTGHGLSNVTASLTKAQNRKPALVRQVSKSGKTAQARKQYKLTTAGVAAIRGALAGRTTEADED